MKAFLREYLNTDLNKVREQIIHICGDKAFLSHGNCKFKGAKAVPWLVHWTTSEETRQLDQCDR